VWQGQRTWNGVAILSRNAEPIVTRTALPRRSIRHAIALHRGGGRRDPCRLHLPAQRQSLTRPEIRLQACLVQASANACTQAPEGRCACGSRRRLQRRAHGDRHLSPRPLGTMMHSCSRRVAQRMPSSSRRVGPMQFAISIRMSASIPSRTAPTWVVLATSKVEADPAESARPARCHAAPDAAKSS
jgi:hypothetical protein